MEIKSGGPCQVVDIRRQVHPRCFESDQSDNFFLSFSEIPTGGNVANGKIIIGLGELKELNDMNSICPKKGVVKD